MPVNEPSESALKDFEERQLMDRALALLVRFEEEFSNHPLKNRFIEEPELLAAAMTTAAMLDMAAATRDLAEAIKNMGEDMSDLRAEVRSRLG